MRAIDLHSQHPDIEEMDFFDFPINTKYDYVVASMVCTVIGLFVEYNVCWIYHVFGRLLIVFQSLRAVQKCFTGLS